MVKRTIEISTDGTRLRSRQRQLEIARDNQVLAAVPFEDLGVLIVDSRAVSLTSAVLDDCAASGSALIVCNGTHTPSALLLPFEGNTLHAERLRAQVSAPQPLVKQLWTRMVQAKIRNQAAQLGPDAPCYGQLFAIADGVKSGDSANAEAHAARLYWRDCFRDVKDFENFSRSRGGLPPNHYLNYGYMVLRATVARGLCAAGMHPALGLHHSNRYNAFALADDVMEPFRPWVDRRVWQLADAGNEVLGKVEKAHLLEVLTDRAQMEGESRPLLVAIERTCASLAGVLMASAGQEKGSRQSAGRLAGALVLPEWPVE